MKSTKQQQALARWRAELIVQVQNGLISVQEVARRLGISRQTYYKWEQRALQAMIEALSNRRHGRPAQPIDREKEALRRQNTQLQRQLRVMEQARRIHLAVLPPDKKKE